MIIQKSKTMKQLILCFLLIAGFTAQAQNLTPFQDTNKKYGFKDAKGNIVVQPKYDDVYGFSEGFASVNIGAKLSSVTKAMTGGKWGFINKTGKVIVEPKYDAAWSFSEGLAAVSQNYKFGFIDKTGKEIVKPQYNEVGNFSEGMAYMRNEDDLYGYIDKTGKVVVEPKYDNAGPFSEGLAAVSQNYKWGFIDKTGKVVIEIQYGGISGFREGLAPVSLNGKHGYIDKTGKAVIPLQYEGGDYFFDGMAAVRKNGKWGFINKTGKFIIEPQYDFAHGFKDGKAKVKLNGREFFIDKTGKEIGSNPQSATTNTNNKPATATSTTLSPNFYNQFKAILNTNWESLKGKGLDVDRDNLGFTEYYQSKKDLDGFELTVEYEENKSGNTTSFDKHVFGENKPNPGNTQLFGKIKTELSKLKNDGFKLESDKNSLYILSGQQEEKVLSELFWDENRIFINFYKSYSVKTVFSNGDVYEGDYRGTTGKTVKGKYTWANGDVYEGDFLGDKFNGKGKLTLKDGRVYEGDFKDGKFMGNANSNTNTNTITITATSSDPMEKKFVTAFNAATNSESRGKALGVLFGDVYKNASLSNEQKKSYMVRKVGEVYAIDKEAVFKGLMGADCSTQEMKEVFNSLPDDQKAFIQKRSQEVSSGFKQVH
ncbi:MAG: WG repeat-containing protein [Chitinophagaceae bacterium]|nr:WG repeat-containing protein [Chitinophagaceae bacterium]